MGFAVRQGLVLGPELPHFLDELVCGDVQLEVVQMVSGKLPAPEPLPQGEGAGRREHRQQAGGRRIPQLQAEPGVIGIIAQEVALLQVGVELLLVVVPVEVCVEHVLVRDQRFARQVLLRGRDVRRVPVQVPEPED